MNELRIGLRWYRAIRYGNFNRVFSLFLLVKKIFVNVPQNLVYDQL